jgi:cation transport regulator
MPYKVIADLPDPVRHHLPQHAQEIYLKAFNNAWHTYHDSPDIEGTCARVAWAAVKKEYEKGETGEWHKKKS